MKMIHRPIPLHPFQKRIGVLANFLEEFSVIAIAENIECDVEFFIQQ
jgi:hypothetical protein